MKRIFLAHPISVQEERLNELKVEVAKAIVAANLTGGEEFDLVLGRDDHAARFALEGGWQGWIHSVAEGVYTSLAGVEPRFHGYVVAPSQAVGKATAEILQKAMRRGKLVVYLSEQGELKRVSRVMQVDREDFRAGWIASD